MCTGNAFFDGTMKVCAQCPVDTVPTQEHTACSCKAGQMWEASTQTCTLCPANHYSEGSSTECTKCPLYTVAGEGARECQPCQNGEYWNEYSCEICNDSDQVGNGVFCVTQQHDAQTEEYRGSARRIKGGPKNGVSGIFIGIIVILVVVCLTLAVLLVARQRKQKKKKAAVTMSYSTAPLTGESESDWQDMRAESAHPPHPSEERSLCGAASEPMVGSEENIYTFLNE